MVEEIPKETNNNNNLPIPQLHMQNTTLSSDKSIHLNKIKQIYIFSESAEKLRIDDFSIFWQF